MINSWNALEQNTPFSEGLKGGDKSNDELRSLVSEYVLLKGNITTAHINLSLELGNDKMFNPSRKRNIFTNYSLIKNSKNNLRLLEENLLGKCEYLAERKWLSESDRNFYNTLQKEKAVKIEGGKRDRRIITDAELVRGKLEKELKSAKKQLNGDVKIAGDFSYLKTPIASLSKEPVLMDFNDEITFPTLEKKLEQIGTYQVGIAHEQGIKPSQEDQSIAISFSLDREDGSEEQVMLTGIFDGHKGSEASEYVKLRLPDVLKRNLQDLLNGTLKGDLAVFNTEKNLTEAAIWNILKITCVDISDECKKSVKKGGTTGSFSVLLRGDLWTVNVGDSRTFLLSGRDVICLSEDAKLEFKFPYRFNEEEFTETAAEYPNQGKYEKSIWKRDGYVEDVGLGIRIMMKLAVARAFGDAAIEGVSARPKITKVPLNSVGKEGGKIFLVHASDGLWDVVTSEKVAEVIYDHQADTALDELAGNLTYSAVKAGSLDNVSVVIVNLSENRPLF